MNQDGWCPRCGGDNCFGIRINNVPPRVFTCWECMYFFRSGPGIVREARENLEPYPRQPALTLYLGKGITSDRVYAEEAQ